MHLHFSLCENFLLVRILLSEQTYLICLKFGAVCRKIATKLSRLSIHYIQGEAKKSSLLKFIAIFSATTWNFNMEFYTFIYRNVLHLTVK